MHYDKEREAELEVARMIANQPDPLLELLEEDYELVRSSKESSDRSNN